MSSAAQRKKSCACAKTTQSATATRWAGSIMTYAPIALDTSAKLRTVDTFVPWFNLVEVEPPAGKPVVAAARVDAARRHALVEFGDRHSRASLFSRARKLTQAGKLVFASWASALTVSGSITVPGTALAFSTSAFIAARHPRPTPAVSPRRSCRPCPRAIRPRRKRSAMTLSLALHACSHCRAAQPATPCPSQRARPSAAARTHPCPRTVMAEALLCGSARRWRRLLRCVARRSY